MYKLTLIDGTTRQVERVLRMASDHGREVEAFKIWVEIEGSGGEECLDVTLESFCEVVRQSREGRDKSA